MIADFNHKITGNNPRIDRNPFEFLVSFLVFLLYESDKINNNRFHGIVPFFWEHWYWYILSCVRRRWGKRLVFYT